MTSIPLMIFNRPASYRFMWANLTSRLTLYKRHDMNDHTYADDNQIYFHSPRQQVELNMDKMRACVNDISDWMFSNRLCLNSDKTEFIWLTSLQNANKVPSGKVNVCGSSEIEPASSVSEFGSHIRSIVYLSRSHIRHHQIMLSSTQTNQTSTKVT